jgi:hypothetical protein
MTMDPRSTPALVSIPSVNIKNKLIGIAATGCADAPGLVCFVLYIFYSFSLKEHDTRDVTHRPPPHSREVPRPLI